MEAKVITAIADKITFIEWWGALSATEKDGVCIDLSCACNTALDTVRSWARGYRTPKARSQELIVNYLQTSKGVDADCTTLFPKN